MILPPPNASELNVVLFTTDGLVRSLPLSKGVSTPTDKCLNPKGTLAQIEGNCTLSIAGLLSVEGSYVASKVTELVVDFRDGYVSGGVAFLSLDL